MEPIEVCSTIDASPEAVWLALTDGTAYAEWDSGMRVKGRIAADQKLKVTMDVSPFPFWLKITEFLPAAKMTWNGGMPLGLFSAIRTFTLLPDGGTTKFVMREEFSGPLLPVMGRMIPADLGESFEQFAAGLKRRVEELATTATRSS